MYVTDRPVMDRLTDPLTRVTESAVDTMEDGLVDLAGWREELHCANSPYDLDTIVKGLSDAADAVVTASQEIRDALTQHHNPTL